jgi:hypothetical protein
VYEASILDEIEDTMKAGDDLNNAVNQEWENIKSTILLPKLWKKKIHFLTPNKTEYRLNFSIKNIAEVFHLKPNNVLFIDVTKNDDNDNWEICLMIHSNNGGAFSCKTIGKEVSQTSVKTFPTIIKRHIMPYFNNINTLIKAFNEKS